MYEALEWRDGWLWIQTVPFGPWRRASEARTVEYLRDEAERAREAGRREGIEEAAGVASERVTERRHHAAACRSAPTRRGNWSPPSVRRWRASRMREHPIIFSGPMVRALLDGRKTQTRRLAWRVAPAAVRFDDPSAGMTPGQPSPWQRVQPGDRLWVREAWKLVPASAYRCSEGVQQTLNPNDPDWAAVYRAGWDRSTGGTPWRPSIHMPRWASRITLHVEAVRVERLQDITDADAAAEGVAARAAEEPVGMAAYRFRDLWDSLHGPEAWDANPEVVVLQFRELLEDGR